MIDAILRLLKTSETKLEPSSVYRQRLAEIDVPAAAAVVDAAKARRDAVLLRGTEAEAEQADREVAAAARNHDRLQLAARELERLALESARREAQTELDGTAAMARDAQADSLRCLVEIDRHASELARLLDQLDTNRRVISEANAALGEAGRRGDRVSHPLVALAEHLDLKVEGWPRIETWQLQGYRGYLVDPRYRFDRARELLPAGNKAARRAA
ncbi:hypothetical protein [Reyranella sp.]|uniref:hypothetical protein n=1 Tax=Reyranella sp. TaxID=1929291 RepID=UPI0037848074